MKPQISCKSIFISIIIGTIITFAYAFFLTSLSLEDDEFYFDEDARITFIALFSVHWLAICALVVAVLHILSFFIHGIKQLINLINNLK